MLYVKSEAGELIPINYGGVFAKCPGCGTVHQVDLSEMMECCGGDVEDCNAYCETCSKKHLPMWERMDEIEFVASRFLGTSIGQVTDIVRRGLDEDLSFETALVGARLSLANETGQDQLFTLDEVASVLGCTAEAAESQMEQLGISPIKVSALPGFEWALDRT